ncbi:hypothetical protein F2P81_000251 [Scophthalmus maximus]|uniref:Uncharacterized protein n=1 Tax=Scophthalmus maximus TaxID=52904 RepID=A0A6A4TQH3_SCOMX|nr:hypothetical protein F2P81_000251 [Scophthalmus maximus]
MGYAENSATGIEVVRCFENVFERIATQNQARTAKNEIPQIMCNVNTQTSSLIPPAGVTFTGCCQSNTGVRHALPARETKSRRKDIPVENFLLNIAKRRKKKDDQIDFSWTRCGWEMCLTYRCLTNTFLQRNRTPILHIHPRRIEYFFENGVRAICCIDDRLTDSPPPPREPLHMKLSCNYTAVITDCVAP